MTAAEFDWLLQRTDEAVPRYLGTFQNSFVWVRNPEAALRFVSKEHAKVLGGAMSPPSKAVREDELNDTDTEAT
jgi:hypothetical protein